MIYSLLYVSRRRTPPAEQAAEIDHILSVARQRNLSLGITGALAATQAYFAQVLEGTAEHAEIIMNYIRQDERHCDIRIVLTESLPQRRFGTWSMACMPPTAEVESALEMLSDDARETDDLAGSLIALLQQSTGALLSV